MTPITLAWPPNELSPNSRLHWTKVAKAKKAYRNACALEAIMQGIERTTATRLHLSLEFVPPTRRAFDLDGLLSRMKAGIDGLADVLGLDDGHWEFSIARSETPIKGGIVRVTITPLFNETPAK